MVTSYVSLLPFGVRRFRYKHWADRAPQLDPRPDRSSAMPFSSFPSQDESPAAGANGHAAQDHKSTLPGEFSIDEVRPMKVVCVGAGLSGIMAAIR